MPRIHQNAEKYAVLDFQTEIRKKQGEYDLMSVRALASRAGIPQSTLNPKIRDPDKLLVPELRKLIRTLHPDIGIILVLLGYSPQEIKRFSERKENSYDEKR